MAHIMQAQPATGLPPFGGFSGGAFDTVNNANLNVQFQIPIIQKAGRGTSFPYRLTYNSSVWYNNSNYWTPASPGWGWTAITQAATGYLSYSTTQAWCYISPNNYYFTIWANWVYVDAAGVAHYLSAEVSDVNTTPCNPNNYPPESMQATAIDGSGVSVALAVTGTYLSNSTLTSNAGVVINAPLVQQGVQQGPGNSGTVTDTNGNEITATYSSGTTTFLDTLSSSNAALTVTGAGTPSSPTVFTYPNPQSGSSSFQMKYTAYTVRTNFGCSGITEYGAQSQNLVSSIVLPDGTQYTITYETTPGHSPNVTGRIASITLPTGGTFQYAYSGGSNGITCADGTTATLTRTTPDGAWSYAHTESGTQWATTITDAQSNQTVMSFQTIYETLRQAYQGSSSTGTLLQTVDTCYNSSAGTTGCTGTAVGLPIGKMSKITTLPGSTKLLNEKLYTYNSTYGLLEEIDEYDWGQGAVGALTRKTITAYASLGNGIMNRPSSVTVETSGGAAVAQTTYSYDGSSVVGTTGTPQHVNPTGSRGNATTISQMTSGSSTISKTLTYFDTGNVQTVMDTNVPSTTHTYTYSNATASCGNAFPTGVNEPLTLTRSFVWNCSGAVQTSETDENSKTWTTTYNDPNFWRPTASTDPTNAQTALAYSISPSAWATESTLNFNGTTSTADTRTTLDSQGRPHVTQQEQSQGSSNYDSVETEYDLVGRPKLVTIPYTGTAGQTTSSGTGTTTAYDALNRPTEVTDADGGWTKYTYTQNDVLIEAGPLGTGDSNTKKRQLQYDGLGRLTSVCELTNASGSGTCGQTTSQTGFWTKYTYDLLNDLTGVTQNAQSSSTQTRTYQYDGLSRLTSEANPETNGSAYTYTFDTDSTCGTSNGDPVKRSDPVGDVTCYAYDALHRVTAVTYPSGSYASVTPAKYFVYDSATVNSVSMSNAKGRLAEACTGTCASPTTVLGFSYSSRGELTDVYQSTPHSGGYYHVNASYWANGLQNTLNANLSGLPNWTYSADGEGRWNAVSASAGQNPVSSTSYNTYSEPTAVNFGSSDSDAFSFDSNTGRMTQYQAKVGSYSMTGALTWNWNGSLYTLGITDTYTSTNNQTCTYQHDDLARLSSADCGSGKWGQGFTYDPFGNISKSQLSGHTGQVFSVSYSTTNTNRISTAGYTYDANGNLTADNGTHTYCWDAEGNLSSLLGPSTPCPTTLTATTETYDALNRRVEQLNSGAYTEILYAPSGAKLALMNGQTVAKMFVSLPGGATAVYAGTSLSYYRHPDWLGSSRVASTTSQAVYYDGSYAPFGESYNESGTTDRSFTGQNQDLGATDLYDFPNREHSAIEGRWVSPDPAGLDAVDPTMPQSWNRYAYVGNNPLGYTDPSGLFIEAAGPGSAAGPIGTIIGGLIDLGELLGALFGLFGGGSSQPTFSTTVWDWSPIQTPPLYDPSTLGIDPDQSVLIIPGLTFYAQGTAGAPASPSTPCTLNARDRNYLNLYYKPVSQAAPNYKVSPALVLGIGAESSFASAGTYLRTGDAFGMTGGSTANMTTAASPTQNVNQFFTNYGSQVQGAGSNVKVFLNGLQGRNPLGQSVKGWKVFNSVNPVRWRQMATGGINQMQREVPIYSKSCVQ